MRFFSRSEPMMPPLWVPSVIGSNRVRVCFAGRIIHHHRRAFRSQRLGNRDGEFLDPHPCRQALLETWGDGWSRLLGSGVTFGGGPETHGNHSRRPQLGHAGCKPPGGALCASCGTDCSAGETLRRSSMEVAERAQESICGIQPAGGIGTAKAEINCRILRCYSKHERQLSSFHFIESLPRMNRCNVPRRIAA